MISDATTTPKQAPSAVDVRAVGDRVKAAARTLGDLRHELEKVIVGQRALLDRILIALLANGHILIEGVPGLAKTTTVATLARAIHARFQRIQFTPDLLPADLTGTQIYNPKTGDFTVKKGPVFANIVLADEINRAPAKVQSALLEAMQERQVTIGGETFPLPEPFLVLATENPIEQEGTYPLPEAQVDRFMMKILVTYPSTSEEREILDRQLAPGGLAEVKPVVAPDDIARLRALCDEVYVDDKIRQYCVSLVQATRNPKAFKLDIAPLLDYGASPRATIWLAAAARAHAFLQGRGFVTPQDVKAIAPDVLRHRLILSYEAEAEEVTPDAIVSRILDQVEVP
jgi:MoxR-like ATPase